MRVAEEDSLSDGSAVQLSLLLVHFVSDVVKIPSCESLRRWQLELVPNEIKQKGGCIFFDQKMNYRWTTHDGLGAVTYQIIDGMFPTELSPLCFVVQH